MINTSGKNNNNNKKPSKKVPQVFVIQYVTLLFVSTGEIPAHGVKRKCSVEQTFFFSHGLCIIEVLTTHSH